MNEYSGYGDNDNYKAYIFPPGKLRLNWILNAHTTSIRLQYGLGGDDCYACNLNWKCVLSTCHYTQSYETGVHIYIYFVNSGSNIY